MLKTIPVYVIDGLLESGKTTFIKDTITSDDFFKKGITLILSGEEGEVEYEQSFLDKYNCQGQNSQPLWQHLYFLFSI